jgi:hypothetical protein
MDNVGPDVTSVLLIDVANAVHTGGTLYGLEIEGIVAQGAEETAIFIGATWDIDIHFGSATALVNWFETGNLTFSDYSGDIDLILTDMPDHGAADITVAAMELDIAMDIMDAGDIQYGFHLDVANAVHTGGTLYGAFLDLDGAQAANEVALVITDSWDIELQFLGGGDIYYGNNSSIRIRDAGSAFTFYLRDVPAAGVGNDLVEIEPTLSAMDGAGDIYRALYFDIDNADHTNGTLYGIDLNTDAQDAQAEEVAIFVSGGFDYDFRSAGVAFAALGAPANGTFVYCTDCDRATPCGGGANGAFAFRLNGAWDCN